jgi:hypothetical protein
MTDESRNDGRSPIGYLWLWHRYDLRTTKPYIKSYTAPGARRTEVHGHHIVEYYPRHYGAYVDNEVGHLRFALRHEPTDLRVLVGALRGIGAERIAEWVRSEPTGGFSRRAWFFYETFVGGRLDLPDARYGNYVEALDSSRHIVGERRNSPRHRVIDNLLGGPELCPTVRKTARLQEQLGLHVDEEARALLKSYDPVTLARAVSYLYTKETRSSFAIEGETPTPSRTERFVAALRSAARFQPDDKGQMISLQNKIVDPRYAARDWRACQNFIGSTTAGYREEVHFICPRREDVPRLMKGWSELTNRVSNDIDPVIAAAVSAFAFVFIHPFEDGNGRIHRFLMHHVLTKTGFSPEGVIFPVSASIVRDQRSYDEVLESFSQPLFRYIEWFMDEEGELAVLNDTRDLYRFFDATPFAEYLHDRVGDTVKKDLKDELNFIAIFDLALETVRRIVDMPDRRASLLVRLCMQNGGKLSANKRATFAELSDEEIAAMERAVQRAVDALETAQQETQPSLL